MSFDFFLGSILLSWVMHFTFAVPRGIANNRGQDLNLPKYFQNVLCFKKRKCTRILLLINKYIRQVFCFLCLVPYIDNLQSY